MRQFSSDQRSYFNQIEAAVARLPSLSTTVAKVLKTCNNPQSSPNELNRLIALDPVLAGQVLRLINSAYYSLCQPVSSLTRAIIMLGVNTVKNLVLSCAILQQLRAANTFRALSAETFWQHSVAVGVIAKCIAVATGVPLAEQEDFFVGGLMHDLGKIPLDQQFADDYGLALDLAHHNRWSTDLAERVVLGIDHTSVGGLIAKKWQLSPTFFDVLACHHRPDESQPTSQKRVFIVALADRYARLLERDHPAEIPTDMEDAAVVLTRVGMDWPSLDRLRDTVLDEIEKAKIFLEVSQKGSRS